MTKIAAGAAVALMLLTGVACSVSADDAVTREAQDRAEIEALMWRYVRALDTADADAYASVYTEDGQFATGGNVTTGREAIHAMVADMRRGRDEAAAKGTARAPMYHMIMNHRLEFVGEDRARMEAYWQTVFGATGGTPVRVAAAGRSVDELVRVDGRWLIQSRNVAPDDE